MGFPSVGGPGGSPYTQGVEKGGEKGCGKKAEKGGGEDDGTITEAEFKKLPPEMQSQYEKGEDGKYQLKDNMV